MTLKKIWTYFTAKQTNIYIDKLKDFVKSYKHLVPTAIGMRQVDVREKYQDGMCGRPCGNNLHRPKKPSVVGKTVRISKIKAIEKGYIPNLSEDHFHI